MYIIPYPNKDKKGIWIIFGGVNYESKDALVVCKRRPHKSYVRKLTTTGSNKTIYDYICVEQYELQK